MTKWVSRLLFSFLLVGIITNIKADSSFEGEDADNISRPKPHMATVFADIIKPSGTQTTEFSKNVIVDKDLVTKGNATISGNLTVSGGTFHGLNVTGATNLKGKVTIAPIKAATKIGTTKISGASTAGGPSSVSFAPMGNFIAVVNQSSNNVQTFSVDSSGNLSSVTSTKSTGNNPNSVAWAPHWSGSTGGFIAVANRDGNTIQIFGVDTSGHISSVISSQTTSGGPIALAWSPNWSVSTGGLVAVSNNSGNTVQIFGVDTSGNLSSVISTQSVTNSTSIAWSPNWSVTTGGLIAINDMTDNTLQTFTVDTSGNLSSAVDTATIGVTGSPVAFSPLGNFIAIANADGGTIQIFSVNGSGNLSSEAISTQIVGNQPSSVTWSPHWSNGSGGLIALVNSYGNTARFFSVDTDGNLSSSQVGYSNTGTYPYSVAWAPNNAFIVVANSGSNSIQTFSTTL